MDKVIELLRSQYREACEDIKLAEKIAADLDGVVIMPRFKEKVYQELAIYKEYRDSLWQAMIVLKYLKK